MLLLIREKIMRLPLEITPELNKYSHYESEDDLLKELKKHPHELRSFFLYACDDETWSEMHSESMKEILTWLTEANLQRKFPQEFFLPLIGPIQKHISLLQPIIPRDLNLKNEQNDYFISSFLLTNQSFYFRRRVLNEIRDIKNPTLKVDEVQFNILEMINEQIMTGEIQNLWKSQPDELWRIIEVVVPLGIHTIVEACEIVLRRYIDRNNVYAILITAHQKRLQLLQNASIEFMNNIESDIRLIITPVEFLMIEFLNFKDRAFAVFEKLSSEITHLAFSNELPAESNFIAVIHQCPKLIGLDLSDSTKVSDALENIPERVKEIRLSHCRWINNRSLEILAMKLPMLSTLDLSNNDQLTYTLWNELQKFKRLTSLDISHCYQVGDNELKMILQGSPRLVELKLVDCQKITPDGFFEIGKRLLDLAILNISRTLISDAALIDMMTRCKNLYSIDISRCLSISEKGVLEGIRNCPSLKIVKISNTRLSQSGIEQIRLNNPYLNISI